MFYMAIYFQYLSFHKYMYVLETHITISYSYQLQTFLWKPFSLSALLLFKCMRWLKLHRFECLSVHHMEFTSAGVSSASLSWCSAAEITVLLRIKTLFSPQVWSLEQPDWHCKIDEGSIGLLSSRWSPDGRHILNTTEFHVSVKSVCAWPLAFMCSGVCLCTSLSGFNCCWPVKKGNLKIARHQSLPWPPPHHPQDTCIWPDFIAAFLLASCHTRCWRTSPTLVEHPGVHLL